MIRNILSEQERWRVELNSDFVFFFVCCVMNIYGYIQDSSVFVVIDYSV